MVKTLASKSNGVSPHRYPVDCAMIRSKPNTGIFGILAIFLMLLLLLLLFLLLIHIVLFAYTPTLLIVLTYLLLISCLPYTPTLAPRTAALELADRVVKQGCTNCVIWRKTKLEITTHIISAQKIHNFCPEQTGL